MTENATSTDKNTPASSLADKERELIAQMPYEEARDKLIQAVQALETGGLRHAVQPRLSCLPHRHHRASLRMMPMRSCMAEQMASITSADSRRLVASCARISSGTSSSIPKS